eukprot:TRINITY_DN12005_c0_g1_i1.p1 TRINITY_DN12005_c0_g1~~TRINITY_DN12005_c0_g1_i1.p1  ORF type:complete len:514 (+),score=157.03 TRINITY_DN12005_c0_g1_i1:29-1543(+)
MNIQGFRVGTMDIGSFPAPKFVPTGRRMLEIDDEMSWLNSKTTDLLLDSNSIHSDTENPTKSTNISTDSDSTTDYDSDYEEMSGFLKTNETPNTTMLMTDTPKNMNLKNTERIQNSLMNNGLDSPINWKVSPIHSVQQYLNPSSVKYNSPFGHNVSFMNSPEHDFPEKRPPDFDSYINTPSFGDDLYDNDDDETIIESKPNKKKIVKKNTRMQNQKAKNQDSRFNNKTKNAVKKEEYDDLNDDDDDIQMESFIDNEDEEADEFDEHLFVGNDDSEVIMDFKTENKFKTQGKRQHLQRNNQHETIVYHRGCYYRLKKGKYYFLRQGGQMTPENRDVVGCTFEELPVTVKRNKPKQERSKQTAKVFSQEKNEYYDKEIVFSKSEEVFTNFSSNSNNIKKCIKDSYLWEVSKEQKISVKDDWMIVEVVKATKTDVMASKQNSIRYFVLYGKGKLYIKGADKSSEDQELLIDRNDVFHIPPFNEYYIVASDQSKLKLLCSQVGIVQST